MEDSVSFEELIVDAEEAEDGKPAADEWEESELYADEGASCTEAVIEVGKFVGRDGTSGVGVLVAKVGQTVADEKGEVGGVP